MRQPDHLCCDKQKRAQPDDSAHVVRSTESAEASHERGGRSPEGTGGLEIYSGGPHVVARWACLGERGVGSRGSVGAAMGATSHIRPSRQPTATMRDISPAGRRGSGRWVL